MRGDGCSRLVGELPGQTSVGAIHPTAAGGNWTDLVLFQYSSSSIQGGKLLDRVLRLIEVSIDGYWSLWKGVPVRTVGRCSNVCGPKSRIQWGPQVVQILASSNAKNDKNGDSQQKKDTKCNSNADDCTLGETLVGSIWS
jgi:hypothetical protein